MCRKRIASLALLGLCLALTALEAQNRLPSPSGSTPPNGRVEWQAVPEARAYLVSLQDSGGNLVLETRTEEPHLDLALEPGRYRIKITALNKFLKAATESSWSDLVIARAVKPVVDSVEPLTLSSGGIEEGLALSGSGLSAETRASLASSAATFEGRIAGEPSSASLLRLSFDLSSALPGAYDLVVENPGNQRFILKSAVRLLPPEVYLSLSLPTKAGAGSATVNLTEALPLPAVQESKHEPAALPATEGSAPADTTLPRPAPGAKAARVFPRPPGHGIWLEAGWSAGLLLDGRMATRYAPSYGGGKLALVLPAGLIRGCPPPLRVLALELRADGNYYPGQGDALGKASFILVGATLGLAWRSDFAFPVNLVARMGGGLAVSYLSSSSVITAGTDLSYDPALRAGLGIRVALGPHYLELGADYLWVSYIDKAQGMARAGLLFGLQLSR